jgi:hypothetical protein
MQGFFFQCDDFLVAVLRNGMQNATFRQFAFDGWIELDGVTQN